MRTKRRYIIFALLIVLMILLFISDLLVGDVVYTPSEVWQALIGNGDDGTRHIITQIRSTRVLVALLIGVALPVCGLMMQTIFQNPLADPYILGVSSGTGLGVALFFLGLPLLGATLPQWILDFGLLGAGWIGALMVLLLILILSRRIQNIFGVLIIGVMLSYIVSSIIQILQYYSSAEQLQLYTLWNLGSLSNITRGHLNIMMPLLLLGILLSFLSVKALNLQLLGDEYAQTMGMNIKRTRSIVFGATTLMAGTITAYCGPIGFIGLAIPHATRYLFRTSDHTVLLPSAMLVGASAMLICDIIAKLLVIPINSVTALLGIPIILKVILNQLSRR
ncbi:MAG: iron ABC transporter permease [Bacteroidales bacterium]|uniref:FecCD family ABC transporter permease n=1 Tax=Porphyromonas sp. TaxID=1924944 RepID=UPI002978E1DA|nr:iron ABC transporter permease [Porphyromonas sp.]MDD7437381.1 iron ABC transporter permease [Bacteroidales bacterium]MDY3066449.1 iron ABC transporter permease [Porphyromonas sp.]